MDKTILNSLFKTDRERFEKVKADAIDFNRKTCGRNIIQNDIFLIMENYVSQKGEHLEVLMLPVDDTELCACTFIKKNKIFVVINSKLPVSKQIFAAAHELYHIWSCLECDEESLRTKGSILKSDIIDDNATAMEDREANAFAGQFLAPAEYLDDQTKIYGIKAGRVSLADVLLLMDIFAFPYKAMVLRLLEEDYIDEEEADSLLRCSKEEISEQKLLTGKGNRWQQAGGVISLGSLEGLLKYNEDMELLTAGRLSEDKERIAEIKREYSDI